MATPEGGKNLPFGVERVEEIQPQMPALSPSLSIQAWDLMRDPMGSPVRLAADNQGWNYDPAKILGPLLPELIQRAVRNGKLKAEPTPNGFRLSPAESKYGA